MDLLIIAIFLVIILIKFYYYNNGNYKKESGVEYYELLFNKGYIGEYKVFKELERLGKINGYIKILTNVYLPKGDGSTTEIDLILLHATGIYVLESKNYKGWIFGDEENKNWVQTFKNGKKYQFLNPIIQNKVHIKYLKKILSNAKIVDNINNESIKSIIVFGDDCNLKKINLTSNIQVLQKKQLYRSVMKLMNNNSNYYFNSVDISKLYDHLKQYSNKSKDEKLEHIKKIKSYH